MKGGKSNDRVPGFSYEIFERWDLHLFERNSNLMRDGSIGELEADDDAA